jgi:hypothetical protein
MKKILGLIAGVLALNFIALAGSVGYLFKSGHLDKTKISAIKEILFPPPPPAVAIVGAEGASTQPSVQLDELLKKAAGRSAEEQVEFLQRSFDSRMAELDLRQRQLNDQQHQIEFGRTRLVADRTALEAEKKQLKAAEEQAAVQASDQGFQDSLALYSNMPAKQVKTIFLTLSDETMMRYLEAMPPKSATKIIKEFKSPDETDRIQKVMERMRQRESAATQPVATVGQQGP